MHAEGTNLKYNPCIGMLEPKQIFGEAHRQCGKPLLRSKVLNSYTFLSFSSYNIVTVTERGSPNPVQTKLVDCTG